METVKITNEKLNKFVLCGKHYVTVNVAKKSLLWVAVDTILELAIKKLKKVERQKDLIRMKHCKKTATQHVDFDKKGNYQFTEETNIKVLEAFDKIDEELVEIPQMIVAKGEYPEKGLTYDIRDSFKGIVIAENEYQDLITLGTIKEYLEKENERIEQEEEEVVEQE